MKKFKHKPNPIVESLPQLESMTLENGSRFYKSPTNGKWVPSVTTVIGHEKKEFFAEWRQKPGNAEIADYACIRGNRIHGIAERYVLNELDPSLEDETAMNLFWNIQQVVDKHIDNIVTTETGLWSDLLAMAGRVDMIAEYDGVPSVIDFKGSNRPKKSEWIEGYFLQASSYAVMWEERTGQKIDQIVIIVAVENPDGFQVFRRDVIDYVDRIVEVCDNYIRDTIKELKEQKNAN